MLNTITHVVVKLQILGLHCWRKVNIPNVDFLAHKHRHTFFISCTKQVQHDDRDIEVIQFKEQIEEYLLRRYRRSPESTLCDFGEMSCEMIAKELLYAFQLNSCSVLEDNENGAVITQS